MLLNISSCAVSISEEHAYYFVQWCQCVGCSWPTRMQRRQHSKSQLIWCSDHRPMIGLPSIKQILQRLRTHLFAVCSPVSYTCYFKNLQLVFITESICLHSHVPDVSVHSGSITGMERTMNIAAVRSLPSLEWVFICLHFAPPKKLFLLCPNLDRKEKAEK